METLRDHLLPELVEKIEDYLYGDIMEEGEFFRAEDCTPSKKDVFLEKLNDMSFMMSKLVHILQVLEDSTQDTLLVK